MKDCKSLALRVTDGKLEVLDQRLLPDQERWIPIEKIDDMLDAIQGLAIRGAPLIGVGAALALAQEARRRPEINHLRQESERLRAARPTAVNLMNALDRMNELLPLAELQGAVNVGRFAERALQIFDEDVRLCQQIATHGVDLFDAGDGVLTHCNTGGLATAGRGTAFGILRAAHEKGKGIHIYVDETRPLLQGGRLTAWECARHGIPHTLIADNMAAFQMAAGRVQKVIVGADRIAVNGDFANKIGTYGLAVLCHYHRIPFYVAAPMTTVDPTCLSGLEIPIEQRDPFEVRGVRGSFGEVRWAPKDVSVDNPAFDVTPAELVRGWILDTGFFNLKDIKDGVLRKTGRV